MPGMLLPQHGEATVPIIAAENDEVIPRASTELLRSRFRAGVATFKVVAGADHNTISERPEYVSLLRGML